MIGLFIIGTIIIAVFVGNPMSKNKNYKNSYKKKKIERRFKK